VKRIAGTALALLLCGAAACGSSDVKADTFRKALDERTDLTKAQLTCVVDKTFETFDQSTINDLYTASDKEDLAAKDQRRFEAIVKGCIKG
jgi:hypothetical protein